MVPTSSYGRSIVDPKDAPPTHTLVMIQAYEVTLSAKDCFGLGDVYYSDLKASRLQTWGPLLQNFLSERSALQTLCHLISSEQEGASKMEIGYSIA